MFTLRNVYNRPLNVELGAAFKGPIHVPAMGSIDVEGKLSDIDPASPGGRYLFRKTLLAEEKMVEKPSPAPVQPQPQAGKATVAEPIKDHPVTISPVKKPEAPATKPTEKKG